MDNLNLTKEEKEIVITQLNGLIGFPSIWKKYLKPIKNPNDDTKKLIVQAKKKWEEVMYRRSVLDKVVEALTEDKA